MLHLVHTGSWTAEELYTLKMAYVGRWRASQYWRSWRAVALDTVVGVVVVDGCDVAVD
jgi:hypothetical protein